MIAKLLASGQLGKLASFVSPAFFDVMPAGALWKRATKLFSDSRDHVAIRHAVASRSESLGLSMPEIELGSAPHSASAAPSLDSAQRAALVAELFFRQLFDDGPTLLDLRASAFVSDGAVLRWKPASWVAQWSTEFIDPLRKLYRGFYTHNDALFRSGLSSLSLSHSADLFRDHFGGNQTTVRFRTAEFIETFHKVFVRCKENGSSLHPDFLPLGIYLAALYDHLQELDVPVDVSAAFDRATNVDGSLNSSVAIHV